MKKKIYAIISVVMIFLLVGCAKNSNNNSSENDLHTEHHDTRQETETKEDESIIYAEELLKHIVVIELTTENWKDYFEVVQEERDIVDAFGEKTGSETKWVLRAKDKGQFAGAFRGDLAIELKYLKTSETTTYSYFENGMSLVVQEPHTIEDYECTRIKGEVVLVNDIPQKYIKTNDKGIEYIETAVEVGYGTMILEKNWGSISAVTNILNQR